MAIRPAGPGDTDFILSSWLESYRRDPATRGIDNTLFYSQQGHRGLVQNLLRYRMVHVACDPSDQDLIYGWVCRSTFTLDYCYVKEARRGQGVARTLIEGFGDLKEPPLRVTHWTQACKRARDRGAAIRWEPHLLTYLLMGER